ERLVGPIGTHGYFRRRSKVSAWVALTGSDAAKWIHGSARAGGFRAAQLRTKSAASLHHQSIHRRLPGFDVGLQLESLDEERPKHGPQLGERYFAAGGGVDVEPIGRYPNRSACHLERLQAPTPR